MSNTNVCNNGVNETGVYNEGLSPGRCAVVRKRGPGRYQAAVRKKWSTSDNIYVTTCHYKCQPSVRGYRQRFHFFWKEKGLFEVGEQRLCDQVRMIQKKDWLSQMQSEEIRRLAGSGENNVKAQQEEKNRTGTEPIQQVTQQHIAQNEENEDRGEENTEILINYVNINTVEKQNIVEKIVEQMKKNNLPNTQNLTRIDRVRLKEKTTLVDEVIDSVQTSNITEDNKLSKCGALVITQLFGIKEIKNKKKEEPFWKKRTESNINTLRKDVSLIERWEAGILRKESQKTRLDHLYRVKRKKYKRAAEELKQRIKAKAVTLKRYKNRVKQYRQNRLFESNQSKSY